MVWVEEANTVSQRSLDIHSELLEQLLGVELHVVEHLADSVAAAISFSGGLGSKTVYLARKS